MEIVCLNNHFKSGIISKLKQACRLFVLKYLSEVYLTLSAIFGRKIQNLLFFIYKIQIYVAIVNHETTEVT
jgi:hypothetical protein